MEYIVGFGLLFGVIFGIAYLSTGSDVCLAIFCVSTLVALATAFVDGPFVKGW